MEEFDQHVIKKLVPYVLNQCKNITKVTATLDHLLNDLISAVGKTNAQEVLIKSRLAEL